MLEGEGVRERRERDRFLESGVVGCGAAVAEGIGRGGDGAGI